MYFFFLVRVAIKTTGPDVIRNTLYECRPLILIPRSVDKGHLSNERIFYSKRAGTLPVYLGYILYFYTCDSH